MKLLLLLLCVRMFVVIVIIVSSISEKNKINYINIHIYLRNVYLCDIYYVSLYLSIRTAIKSYTIMHVYLCPKPDLFLGFRPRC